MENQPNAEQPTAYFISVSGVFTLTPEAVSESGMGHIAQKELLAENGVESQSYSWVQHEEIKSAIIEIRNEHPDVPIAVGGYSAGVHTANGILNELDNEQNITVDAYATLSPPSVITELTAPVGEHLNITTEYHDYQDLVVPFETMAQIAAGPQVELPSFDSLKDDTGHFPDATNIHVNETHLSIDDSPVVQDMVVNFVLDTVRTATCSPHEQASDFYHSDDYQQGTFEATPHLHESHQDFSTFDHESHTSDFSGHDIGYGF